MSVAFVLLAIVAVVAMLTTIWQARGATAPPLASGGPRPHGQRTVVQGEALFATGVDRCTVAFDCLLAAGDGPAPSLEPTSLTLRRGAPTPSGESLADVVRTWAQGGERVFVEIAVDSPSRPFTARLTCGHQGLQAEVADRVQLHRLIGRPSSPLARPR